ncbi:hypothetical protein Droror1_Dr00025531, partial [Drosera rotundifolia]
RVPSSFSSALFFFHHAAIALDLISGRLPFSLSSLLPLEPFLLLAVLGSTGDE